MYRNKHTKNTRATTNMQKILSISYSIICASFFCMFNQIVILIKCTKIYAAEYIAAKINSQKLLQKIFCAKGFDTKIVVTKINSQKFCVFFCNIIFCIKIFLHYSCLYLKYSCIYFLQQTNNTCQNKCAKFCDAKNVDAKFLVAKKTHAKINRK